MLPSSLLYLKSWSPQLRRHLSSSRRTKFEKGRDGVLGRGEKKKKKSQTAVFSHGLRPVQRDCDSNIEPMPNGEEGAGVRKGGVNAFFVYIHSSNYVHTTEKGSPP